MPEYFFPHLKLSIGGNVAGTPQLLAGGVIHLMGGNNLTISQDGSSLSFSAAAGGGGGSVNFSAGGAAADLDAVVFSNSNGLAFGLNGSTITGSYTQSTHSHSSLSFANGGGVTFGIAGSTLTASVETSYAASNHSHGNPTLALTNLSGTTASASNGFTLSLSAAAPGGGGGNAIAAGTRTAGAGSTVLFETGNGITFGLNAVGGSVMTASHNALTTARASNDAIGLNTAQSNVTWTVNSSGLSLDARGYAGTGTSATNASITLNSDGLAISVAAPGGGAGFTRSRFNPFMEAVAVASQFGQGTLHFHPIPDAEAFQFDRVLFDVQGTQATATNSSGSATVSMWAGLYTRNVSTLSLLASSSTTLGLSISGTVRVSLNNGARLMSLGWTTTISQNDLWMGIVSRTTTGGANLYTLSQYAASDINSNFSGVLGEASNATRQNVLGLGVYTASTSGIPGSVAFSHINGTASQFLRVPMYYFLSQTA